MKFSTTPYRLNLRRAHLLQIVLFGAFVYCYVGVLQYERIVHLLAAHLHFSANTYPPSWQIALPPATLAVICATAFGRKVHLPKHWGGEFRLLLFTALSIIFCIVTSPNETDTLTLKTQRLMEQGRYDEAVDASAKFAKPTVAILNNRAKCLHQQNLLCEDFFTYPYGTNPFSDNNIEAILNEISTDVSHDVHSFRFLLRRDLDRLAQYLQNCSNDSLKRAEKEALILYCHMHTEPVRFYSNSALEANYNDFCALYDKLTAPNSQYGHEEVTNLLHEDYGGTYWCYYYMHQNGFDSTKLN